MSATYIHFTLVNHIEVVSFITWRTENRTTAWMKLVKRPDFEAAGKTHPFIYHCLINKGGLLLRGRE